MMTTISMLLMRMVVMWRWRRCEVVVVGVGSRDDVAQVVGNSAAEAEEEEEEEEEEGEGGANQTQTWWNRGVQRAGMHSVAPRCRRASTTQHGREEAAVAVAVGAGKGHQRSSSSSGACTRIRCSSISSSSSSSRTGSTVVRWRRSTTEGSCRRRSRRRLGGDESDASTTTRRCDPDVATACDAKSDERDDSLVSDGSEHGWDERACHARHDYWWWEWGWRRRRRTATDAAPASHVC